MRPFALLLLSLALLASPAQAQQTATLNVTVTNIETFEGHVLVNLHNAATSFPGNGEGVVRQASVKADGPEVTFRYEDVPYGTYAISAFHDVDDNKEINRFLGIPNEPYGASNDARGTFGPPKYEDAAFKVDAPEISLSFFVK